MTNFLKTSITLIAFTFIQTKVFATWSIAVLDPNTKTIGVAAASCTGSVSGVGKIITGKGVIIAQAYSDDGITSRGIDLLRKNASPFEILKALTDKTFDKDVALRQYAIITFDNYDKPVNFTGDSIAAYPYAAAISSPGICVQGNTLADSSLIREVYKAVLAARDKKLSIEEILMIALETGSKFGGDRRCGSQTAQSAFIQIVKPTDVDCCSYLSLRVEGIKQGGKNPIKVLRTELNKIKKHLPENKNTELLIVPKE